MQREQRFQGSRAERGVRAADHPYERRTSRTGRWRWGALRLVADCAGVRGAVALASSMTTRTASVIDLWEGRTSLVGSGHESPR